MIRNIRNEIKIDIKKLAKFVGSKDKGVFYIEKTIDEDSNKTFKYLLFLRKRRVNINKILDDYINDNTRNNDDE